MNSFKKLLALALCLLTVFHVLHYAILTVVVQ